MSIFYRIVLVAFSLGLVAAAYATYASTTQVTIGHETIYTMKSTWVHPIHLVSVFGILFWCLLFARRDPLFVRIGLIAITVAFALPYLRNFHH